MAPDCQECLALVPQLRKVASNLKVRIIKCNRHCKQSECGLQGSSPPAHCLRMAATLVAPPVSMQQTALPTIFNSHSCCRSGWLRQKVQKCVALHSLHFACLLLDFCLVECFQSLSACMADIAGRVLQLWGPSIVEMLMLPSPAGLMVCKGCPGWW